MLKKWRMNENEKLLLQLREHIPFLREIPDRIYFHLDSSEFYVPETYIAEERSKLGEYLGCNIMTYRREIFNLSISIERHLCANIKGAALSSRELVLLQGYERKHSAAGVSFVAYQNPLAFIDPRSSVLQGLYAF